MYYSIFKSIVIISTAIFYWNIYSEKEMEELEFVTKLYHDVFGSESTRYLGKLCIDETNVTTCVSAHDIMYRNKDGKYHVDRTLVEGVDMQNVILAVSPLRIPEFLSPDNLDTRFWEIADGIPKGSPNLYLFKGMLQHGTFDLSNLRGNVLQIGVASGGFLTYLNRNFPEVNIIGVDYNPTSATAPAKWFGYEKSKNSEIVIADGVQYILDAAKNGTSFDAVLVDACIDDNEPEDGLICPNKEFIDENLMEAVKKLIGKTGVVSYTVLAHNAKFHMESSKMKEKLAKYFKQCKFVKHHGTSHTLTCRNHDEGEKEIKEFLKNAKLVPSFNTQ